MRSGWFLAARTVPTADNSPLQQCWITVVYSYYRARCFNLIDATAITAHQKIVLERYTAFQHDCLMSIYPLIIYTSKYTPNLYLMHYHLRLLYIADPLAPGYFFLIFLHLKNGSSPVII